jgi:hypothetical protein
MGFDHFDAQAFEALNRVKRRDGCDDLVDVIMHRLEINLRLCLGNAELL